MMSFSIWLKDLPLCFLILKVFPLFQGVYAARSEVEAARPHNACARQTIRRLVSLGFTLDVLKKSFGADPKYEIPSSVFLQDMTEVNIKQQSLHKC